MGVKKAEYQELHGQGELVVKGGPQESASPEPDYNSGYRNRKHINYSKCK